MPRPAFACGSIAALLVACGARSPLDLPESSAEGGGSTSAAATSSSSGMGGEDPGPCDLVVSGAPLDFADLWPKNPSFWPRLTPVGDSPDRVAVVYRWDPSDKGVSLADIAMLPWGVWNKDMFEQAWGINTQDAGEHVVASAPGDRIAVFTLNGGTAEMYVILPSAPSFDFFSLGGGGGSKPLTVSRGLSDYLVAYEWVDGGEHLTMLGRVGPSGWIQEHQAIACASGPLVADAMPTSNGYLAVLSNGRPFGTCQETGFGSGPPEDMVVLQVGEGLEVRSLVKGDPIEFLAIEPRPGGAWIVVHRQGSALAWQTVDANGYLESETKDFADPPPDAIIATTNAGAWLAAGWTVQGDNSVVVVATDGHDQREITIPLGSHPPDGQISLLGSPDGRYVLVAWSEIQEELFQRVRLARLELTPSCR